MIKTMPKISIIVPVYKVEPYLRRCIDSILAQTFADFELILVDDGNPDRCGIICDEYKEKDARIYVIHQMNGGLSAARNAGIDWAFDNSNSEWLTFIDSDDWVHPKYLEFLYAAVVENNVKISMCPLIETDKYYIDEDDIGCSSKEVTAGEAYILNTRTISAYAVGRLFHKAGCFSNIRFPVGRLWEDLATIYKILWSAKSIALVDRPLYYYFRNSEGIVHSAWCPKKLDELLAYEEQIPFFEGKNENEIYQRLIKTYIMYIIAHRRNVHESTLDTKKKRKYDRLLKRKLRRALWRYGHEVGMTIEKECWIYEMAYPKMMGFYWLFRAGMNKLKRMFGKCR